VEREEARPFLRGEGMGKETLCEVARGKSISRPDVRSALLCLDPEIHKASRSLDERTADQSGACAVQGERELGRGRLRIVFAPAVDDESGDAAAKKVRLRPEAAEELHAFRVQAGFPERNGEEKAQRFGRRFRPERRKCPSVRKLPLLPHVKSPERFGKKRIQAFSLFGAVGL